VRTPLVGLRGLGTTRPNGHRPRDPARSRRPPRGGYSRRASPPLMNWIVRPHTAGNPLAQLQTLRPDHRRSAVHIFGAWIAIMLQRLAACSARRAPPAPDCGGNHTTHSRTTVTSRPRPARACCASAVGPVPMTRPEPYTIQKTRHAIRRPPMEGARRWSLAAAQDAGSRRALTGCPQRGRPNPSIRPQARAAQPSVRPAVALANCLRRDRR
jgi:hypothetical protein